MPTHCLEKFRPRAWYLGPLCHLTLSCLSSFTFHLQDCRDHSLNAPCGLLLVSPLLPSIFTALSDPSLTFPGRMSNFSSVGAYLESSLTVCTRSLRNPHILYPGIPPLKSVLWKESRMLTYTCSLQLYLQ